jgi:hypothetical protein
MADGFKQWRDNFVPISNIGANLSISGTKNAARDVEMSRRCGRVPF